MTDCQYARVPFNFILWVQKKRGSAAKRTPKRNRNDGSENMTPYGAMRYVMII
jgi:hypothetical protein